MDHIKSNQEVMIKNLQHKCNVLQQSGARGLAMPCHLSHAWHSEISEDSSLPFLHIGDCVAMELKKAKMKPIHAASTVRIGLLTTDSFFVVCYYKEKLQSQGFEVVLLDKETEEHLLVPAVEALQRKDIEGARNLLRIAIHVLLVMGVNVVILASDDLLRILPHNDPLIRKCIDPMDYLARSIIHWAETTAKVPGRSSFPFPGHFQNHGIIIVRDVTNGNIDVYTDTETSTVSDWFCFLRNKTHTQYRKRSSNSSISSVFFTDQSRNYEEPSNGSTSLMKTQIFCIMHHVKPTKYYWCYRRSISSINSCFLGKATLLVFKECPPFVVCSDPVLSKALSLCEIRSMLIQPRIPQKFLKSIETPLKN
ncbi:hypothetical protein TSUD_194330 [Trifolium subterraneum]|uniref:Uncharacterized protein n=1 Tax=Trifolium subterraneum TaxID=3900 RepID=A0A2Z6PDZ4_TRISU|nr:hypothetical protein TSUD_194330 [Trifolium subterraneum]